MAQQLELFEAKEFVRRRSLRRDFIDLPDDFTILTTCDAIEYAPDHDGSMCVPLPSRVGGVYVIFEDDIDFKHWTLKRKYLYVGKGLDCRQRLLAHFRRPNSSPFDDWLNYGAGMNDCNGVLFFAVAPCELARRAAFELQMIELLKPKFNRVMR